jgi:hypothetical protein
MSSANSAICDNPIFRKNAKGVPTFSHPAAPPSARQRAPKKYHPASPPKHAGNITAQTIHNSPKLYIIQIMRHQKSNQATQPNPRRKTWQKNHTKISPAIASPQKTSKKYRFLFFRPIDFSFYRCKNTPDKALFLVFLPILPILPMKRLT